MDRRAFLKTLGLGGGAIAFAHSMPWVFPRTVIPYDGPFTFEWFASEAVATTAAKLHGMHLIFDKDATKVGSGKVITHLSNDFIMESGFQKLSLNEIRKRYIDPVASSMADRILYQKPKYSGNLQLPGGIEMARSCMDATTGLNMRFIRAYDIGRDAFVNRCDILIG